MVEITKKQVERIADVARLELTEEEADLLVKELSDMLNQANVLKELDTTDVDPLIRVHDQHNIMRKDEPRQWITQEDALKNATKHKNGQFQVPSILD